MAPLAAKNNLVRLDGLGVADTEVELGEVVGVFGVRGEVRLHLHNREDSLLFGRTAAVTLVAPDGARYAGRVTARAGAGGRILGRIDAVGDPDVAASIKGWKLVMPRSAMPAPDAGEFYVVDLLGAPVFSSGSTEAIGEMVDIHRTPGGDLLEVRVGGEPHFLLLAGPYVLEVDVAGRRVVVDPEGWADE